MKKIDAAALFGDEPPPADATLEGAELVRAYWRVRALAAEIARKERYWSNLCDGLSAAYDDLERARGEHIERLEGHLAKRVEERSRELLAFARGPVAVSPGVVFNGRLTVGEPIGEGGAGVVYRATDSVLGGDLAVKVLRRPGEPAATMRFLAEAGAASRAKHPAIVRPLLLEVTEEGLPYIVMECVEGRSLRAHLSNSGPMSPRAVARLGAVLAHALASAHEADVVHRDVKPANVMLTPRPPGLRVLDFGLALTLETNRLTGTPAYMAPEQIIDPASAREPSDVYSAGATLFEAHAGRPPFVHRTIEAMTRAHLETSAPALEDAPKPLASLVRAMLEKDPANRPSATEAGRELDAIADQLGALTAHAEAMSLFQAPDPLMTL